MIYNKENRELHILTYYSNHKDLTNVVIVFDIIVLLVLGIKSSEVSNGVYLATLFFCDLVFLCEFLASLFGTHSAEKGMQKDFIRRDELTRFCRLSIKIRNGAFITVLILFTLLLVGAQK